MRCLIQVIGVADSGGAETTETICRGIVRELLSEQGGGFRFDYRTSDEENPSDVTANVITITEERAEIRREGSVNATILVVPGETHPCRYETAFGTLTFAIAGHEVSFAKEDDRIVAGLSYTILSGDEAMSENTIRIIAEPIRGQE
ncbi:MAG: DUF1934 domain-containing protein [Lachnospiraceae bacterium]|nr:DUF1934 domain-containing protein [Lachnospiraceae bacterium]